MVLRFDHIVIPEAVHLQFQGGFSAKSVEIVFINDADHASDVIHPHDNNSLQKFAVKGTECTSVKLIFKDLSDFFGRVIIYDLDIIGSSKV